MQKQPLELCKKAVLKNFAIFTRRLLCWRIFLIQNIPTFFGAPIFNLSAKGASKNVHENEKS